MFLACVEALGDRLAFARHLYLGRVDLFDEIVVACCHFFLARLELARDIFIVTDQLFLPYLELFDRLPQGSEIARHRLELLRQIGRQGDGSRRGVFGTTASGAACVKDAGTEGAIIAV